MIHLYVFLWLFRSESSKSNGSWMGEDVERASSLLPSSFATLLVSATGSPLGTTSNSLCVVMIEDKTY